MHVLQYDTINVVEEQNKSVMPPPPSEMSKVWGHMEVSVSYLTCDLCDYYRHV